MRDDPRRPRPLKSLTPGHVQFDSVEWTPACADHRTPESLLVAAEEAREARARDEQHMALVAGLPTHEAFALMLVDGLFGQRSHTLRQVAFALSTTEAEAGALVANARQRVEMKGNKMEQTK